MVDEDDSAVITSDAKTVRGGARDIASAIADALGASDVILVGPLSPIPDAELVLGVCVVFGRPGDPYFIRTRILPRYIDVSSDKARRVFRAAIVDALGRQFRHVKACDDVVEKMRAAAVPPSERRANH
jgi:hypothetical protein